MLVFSSNFHTAPKTVETHFFGVEPLFFGVEPLFFGVERANFAGDPEDQHSHPGMVAVMGKDFAVPVCLVWLRRWGKRRTETVRRGFTLTRYMAMLRNPAK